DSIVEDDESLTIVMSNPTDPNVDASATATLTIRDDDTATLTIQDITVDESDGTQQFLISVDNPVQGGFSVTPSVLGGDATVGDDFQFDSVPAIIFDGDANESRVFTVQISDDDLDEFDETVAFGFSVAGFPDTKINDSDTATLTILDNDDPITPIGSTIQGHAYCDANANEVEDTGEAASGATIFLDRNANRLLDASELSTLTNSAGDFVFNDVPAGDVVVAAITPAGCNTIPKNPGVSLTSLEVGDLARAITATDKDGDGDQDLLVVSEMDNKLTVVNNHAGLLEVNQNDTIQLSERLYDVAAWLPEGQSTALPTIAVAAIGATRSSGLLFHGSLDSMSPEASGSGPVDVAISDFNNDGVADFVTASFKSSSLQLHLSGASQPIQVAAGPLEAGLIRAVTTGDVNADGNQDIVVVAAGYDSDEGGQIGVLLGDGSGGFSSPSFTNNVRDFVEVRIADLGDGGNNEILALTKTGQLLVFGPSLNVIGSTSVVEGASAFDVGDFNRDSKLDVAVANLGDQLIQLMTGNGEGRFTEITRVESIAAPSDLVVVDLNGDGFAEIAVTSLYFLPSTVTIIQLDVAEAPVVIANQTVTDVDFVFPSADPVLRLDTTGDGVVTMQDLLSVLDTMSQNALSERNQPSGESAANARNAADVNGDGETTPQDALLIINYLGEQHHNRLVSSAHSEYLDDRDDDRDEALRNELIDLALSGFGDDLA
ncbi:MAG: FG-GAP-like repeat-containing protein, partial [Pirellulaceae bacterium]